jgi:hypothetical protein
MRSGGVVELHPPIQRLLGHLQIRESCSAIQEFSTHTAVKPLDLARRRRGAPWTRFDIRSALFGDIRNIRNDVVHKHGVVDASAGNLLLDWFAEGQKIEIALEQMMSPVSSFPRQESLTTPVRAQPGNAQNLPWSVAPELVDAVRQIASSRAMTRKQSRDIGNEALRLWIASHRE